MDYNKMTILQLRAAAKEKGLRGISSLKKEALIERLMETGQSTKENVEKPSAEREMRDRKNQGRRMA